VEEVETLEEHPWGPESVAASCEDYAVVEVTACCHRAEQGGTAGDGWSLGSRAESFGNQEGPVGH